MIRSSLSVLVCRWTLFTSCECIRVFHSRDAVEPIMIPLENRNDIYYVARATVGNEDLDVVMDSGSLETVIISSDCDYCGPKQHLYHPADSATHQNTDLMSQQSYGSGQLLTRLAFDNVEIGTFTLAKASMWEVVDAYMPLLQESDFAGIFGLGPFPPNIEVISFNDYASSGSASPGGAAPKKLKNENASTSLQWQLGFNVYSLCLNSGPGSPGQLIFNDNAVEQHGDAFHTVPVLPGLPWWAAELTEVKLGDQTVKCGGSSCAAVIDSGTSLLAVPAFVRKFIASMLEEKGIECSNFHEAPPLHFKLGGKDFSLPARFYIGEVFGALSEEMSGKFDVSDDGCALLFQDFDQQVPDVGALWILGMPFFRAYYTVFSQAPQQMSMAQSEGCSPTSSLRLESTESTMLNKLDVSKVRPPRWLRKSNRTSLTQRAQRKLHSDIKRA